MNKVATTNQQLPATNVNPGEISILPDEVRLPIVGIIQTKNHLLDSSDKYEVGQLVDFSTGEIISTKNSEGLHSLTFIPIHVQRIYICKNESDADKKMFDKNFEPNALIFKTKNPADPRILEEENLAKERDANSRVRKFLQYLCYIEGSDMPMIISFGKSSKVPGEQLLSRISFAKQGSGVDMWKRKYQLSSVPATYKEHNFFKLNFERIGDPTDEEIELAQAWANTIAKQDYEPNVSDDIEEEMIKKESGSETANESEAPY